MPTFEELLKQDEGYQEQVNQQEDQQQFDEQVAYNDDDLTVDPNLLLDENETENLGEQLINDDANPTMVDGENAPLPESDITSSKFTDMDLSERTARSLIAGSAEVVDGIGDIINGVGNQIGFSDVNGNWLGNAIKDTVEGMDEEYANYVPEELRNITSFSAMANPEFWTDNVAKGVPFLLAFMAGGEAGSMLGEGLLKSGLGALERKAIKNSFVRGIVGESSTTLAGAVSGAGETVMSGTGSGMMKALLKSSGELTTTGSVAANMIGGGVATNQLNAALQASAAIKVAKDEKDELGRRLFTDEQISQIGSDTYKMNTAWMAVDMLNWGVTFGKLGKQLRTTAVKAPGVITEQGAKVFGKNMYNFLSKGSKVASSVAFGVTESQLQLSFYNWTVKRANELAKSGRELKFSEFVESLATSKEDKDTTSFGDFFTSDENMATRTMATAFGMIPSAIKSIIDVRAKEQAHINERGELVNEHLANADQIAALKYLQEEYKKNLIMDAVAEGKEKDIPKTIDDLIKRGVIDEKERQPILDQANEYIEKYNEAVELKNEGVNALFRNMVHRDIKKDNLKESRALRQEKIKKVQENDALTEDAKRTAIENIDKNFDKADQALMKEITDHEVFINSLITGKTRKESIAEGLSEKEAEKYLGKDDRTKSKDAKEEEKGFFQRIKDSFNKTKEKIEDKSEEAKEEKPKEYVPIENIEDVPETFTYNEVEYSKGKDGEFVSIKDDVPVTHTSDEILDLYNKKGKEDFKAENKDLEPEDFAERDVYDDNVLNYAKEYAYQRDVVNKDGYSNVPLISAISMIEQKGGDVRNLEKIIDDHIANSEGNQLEYWEKVKEQYENAGNREFESIVQDARKFNDHFTEDVINTTNEKNAPLIEEMNAKIAQEQADAKNTSEYRRLDEEGQLEFLQEIEDKVVDSYQERLNEKAYKQFDNQLSDNYFETHNERTATERKGFARHDENLFDNVIDAKVKERAVKRAILGDTSKANLHAAGPLGSSLDIKDAAKVIVQNRATQKMFPGSKVVMVDNLYNTLGQEAYGYTLAATRFIDKDAFDQGHVQMHEISHVYYALTKDDPATKRMVEFVMKNKSFMNEIESMYHDRVLYKLNEEEVAKQPQVVQDAINNKFGHNRSEDLSFNNAEHPNLKMDDLVDMGLIEKLPMEQQHELLEEAFVITLEEPLNNQYTNLFTERNHVEKIKMFSKKWWKGIKEQSEKHAYNIKEVEQSLLKGKDVNQADLQQYILDSFVKERNEFVGTEGRASRPSQTKYYQEVRKAKNEIAASIINGISALRKAKDKGNEKLLFKSNKHGKRSLEDVFEHDIQEYIERTTEESSETTPMESSVMANLENNNHIDMSTFSKLLKTFTQYRNKLTGVEDVKLNGAEITQELRNIAKRSDSAVDFIYDFRTSSNKNIQEFFKFLERKNSVATNAELVGLHIMLKGSVAESGFTINIANNGSLSIKHATNNRNTALVQKVFNNIKYQGENASSFEQWAKEGRHQNNPEMLNYETVKHTLNKLFKKEPLTTEEMKDFLSSVFANDPNFKVDQVVAANAVLHNGQQFTIGELATDIFHKNMIPNIARSNKYNPSSIESITRYFFNGGYDMKPLFDAVVAENQKYVANDTAISAENNQVSLFNKTNEMYVTADNMVHDVVNNKMSYKEFKEKYHGKRTSNDILQEMYEQAEKFHRINIQLDSGIKNNMNGKSLEFKHKTDDVVAMSEFLLFLKGKGGKFLNSVSQNSDSPRKYYIEVPKLDTSGKKEKNVLKRIENKMKANEPNIDHKAYMDAIKNDLVEFKQFIKNNKQFLHSIKGGKDLPDAKWEQIAQDYFYSSLINAQEAAEIFTPGVKMAEIVKRSKGLGSPRLPIDKNTKLDQIFMEDIPGKDGFTTNDGASFILPSTAKRIQDAYGHLFPVGKAFKFVGYGRNKSGNIDYNKAMTFVLSDQFIKENPKYARVKRLLEEREEAYLIQKGLRTGRTAHEPFGMGTEQYIGIATAVSGVKTGGSRVKENTVPLEFLMSGEKYFEKNAEKLYEQAHIAIENANDVNGKFVGTSGEGFGIQGLMDKEYTQSVFPTQAHSALMTGTNYRGDLHMSEHIQRTINDIMASNLGKALDTLGKDPKDFIVKNLDPDKTDLATYNLLADQELSTQLPFIKHSADNMITNYIKKTGNKLKSPGTIGFESSDYGFTADQKLNGYSIKDGKIIGAGIKLPYSMKGKVKVGDTVFATRIPSHGLQTTGMFVVKGFHDEAQGQMVSASNEFSRIVGSDNDGDALYINTRGKKGDPFNKVMDALQEFYSRPELKETLETPINMKAMVNEAIARMKEVDGVEFSDGSEIVMPFTPMARAKAQTDTVNAKQLVGAANVVHVVSNYFATYGIESALNFDLNGTKLDAKFKDGGVDANGKYVHDQSNTHKTAMLMNIVMDNANNKDATKLGISSENLMASALLTRLGASYGDIAILNNSKAGRAWVKAVKELNNPLTAGQSSLKDVANRALEILGVKKNRKASNKIDYSNINDPNNMANIINLYSKLDAATHEINIVNKIISGHNKLNSDVFVLEKQLNDFNKLSEGKNTTFKLNDKFLNNPTIKRYVDVLKKTIEVNKKNSQTYNNTNNNIKRVIEETAIKGEGLTETQIKSLTSAFDIISAGRLLGHNKMSVEALRQAKTDAIINFANYIAEGRLENTEVLKQVFFANKHGNERSISVNHNLFKNENGASKEVFDLAREEFGNLPNEIKEDLITYDLLENGFQGNKSFSYLFDKPTLKEMSKNADKLLRNKNEDTPGGIQEKMFYKILKVRPDLISMADNKIVKIGGKFKYQPNTPVTSDMIKILEKGTIVRKMFSGRKDSNGKPIKVIGKWVNPSKERVLQILDENGYRTKEEFLNEWKKANDGRLNSQASTKHIINLEKIAKQIALEGHYKEMAEISNKSWGNDNADLIAIDRGTIKPSSPNGKPTVRVKARTKEVSKLTPEQQKALNALGGLKKKGNSLGRASRTNIEYYKYRDKIDEKTYKTLNPHSSRKAYENYTRQYDKAKKVFHEHIANGKVQSLSDAKLKELWTETAKLDGLAGSVATTPLAIERARRDAIEQLNFIKEKTGVDVTPNGKDMTALQKWLGSNNIPQDFPALQRLVRNAEVHFNKFIRERNKYYDRIDAVTKALYKEKFGGGLSYFNAKHNPFASKSIYEKLYGNLVMNERGVDANGNKFDNFKLKPRDEIMNLYNNGKISKAELDYYNVFDEVLKELAPFNNSKLGLRTDYIPHTQASNYEAFANRGMLGMYMNMKGSDFRIGDAKVSGLNPATGKIETMEFRKFKDLYATVSKSELKNNPKYSIEYAKIRSKAKRFTEKGINEDGSRIVISKDEINSLLDQGSLNRFEKSRSKTASDMPSMDLNKALIDYVHTSLFNNGNSNIEGMKSMQMEMDGIIAEFDQLGYKNAKEYVQKVWKDKFLSGVKPTSFVGKAGDKAIRAGVTYTLFKGLAFNYGIAVGNIIVGKYQNIRNAGGKAWALGEKRFYGIDKLRTPKEYIEHMQKVQKILKDSGFMAQNIYDDINLEQKHNVFNVLESLALGGMIYSEKVIQQPHFLGLLTEKEWNSYDSKGNLKPGEKGITPERQMEIEDEVKRSHGRGYQMSDQRLVSLYSFGQAFMQFSRYIPSMFEERFGYENINIYGQKQIGSLRQFGRVAEAYAKGDISPKEFNEFYSKLDDANKKALRSALVGMGMIVMAGIVMASGDKDDKRRYYAKGLISDANIAMHPNRLVKKLHPPVAHTGEDFAKNLLGMLGME